MSKEGEVRRGKSIIGKMNKDGKNAAQEIGSLS